MPLHVVTVEMEYAYTPPGKASRWLVEIFRGEEAECVRIADAIAGAYDDQRRIKATRVGWGSLADWEQFLADCDAP